MLSKAIINNRRVNTIEWIQAQKRDHKNPFQLFSDSYSFYRGSLWAYPGVIFPQINKDDNLCHATQSDQPKSTFTLLNDFKWFTRKLS